MRTIAALIALALLGVLLALGLLSNDELRRVFRISSEAINPLAWLQGRPDPDEARVVPLEAMKTHGGASMVKRASWEDIEHRPRPRDKRTDPLRGTTEMMFLDTPHELALAKALQHARLPNKVLKVGIATRSGVRTSAKDKTRRPVGEIGLIEIYSGEPMRREAIEESVDRAVQVAFDTVPSLREVDVDVVPWRTVQGMKPPVRFSVSALRSAWFSVSGVRSHGENLRTCGAVWVDSHVMSAGMP